MPHFPARARRTLAVEMDSGTGNREPPRVILDVVADQIGHGDLAVAHRLAERPTGNGADVLLELRDGRAVERPMAGIMYPRRVLVEEHFGAVLLLHHEHFDREHADIVQRG